MRNGTGIVSEVKRVGRRTMNQSERLGFRGNLQNLPRCACQQHTNLPRLYAQWENKVVEFVVIVILVEPVV